MPGYVTGLHLLQLNRIPAYRVPRRKHIPLLQRNSRYWRHLVTDAAIRSDFFQEQQQSWSEEKNQIPDLQPSNIDELPPLEQEIACAHTDWKNEITQSPTFVLPDFQDPQVINQILRKWCTNEQLHTYFAKPDTFQNAVEARAHSLFLEKLERLPPDELKQVARTFIKQTMKRPEVVC